MPVWRRMPLTIWAGVKFCVWFVQRYVSRVGEEGSNDVFHNTGFTPTRFNAGFTVGKGWAVSGIHGLHPNLTHHRVVYQGNTQLAGPLSIGPPIHSKSDSNPERFDWRAMRTEVMKMKLPWEMAGDSPASPASLPYSSSTPLHSSSSFTEQELSPADMHFRQLLRPRLWSSSNTFSRMAAAGMRWGEFDGVDPNSTDESGSDEPDEPRLGSTIRA